MRKSMRLQRKIKTVIGGPSGGAKLIRQNREEDIWVRPLFDPSAAIFVRTTETDCILLERSWSSCGCLFFIFFDSVQVLTEVFLHSRRKGRVAFAWPYP